MITFQDLSLRRGSKLLFHSVNLSLHAHQKIGIVGENGCGKSSLLSLILNQIEPEIGKIEVSKKAEIAYVEQEYNPPLHREVIESVIDADVLLRKVEADLKNQDNTDPQRLSELYSQFEQLDGYTANSRAATLLDGLGFSQEQMHQTASQLSGGFRVRLQLARALMKRSNILLLDEPTNHLDLDAIIWLEQFLVRYKGMLLLITHDRKFLDQIATDILHIEHQSITAYTGNYSAFEEQRTANLIHQQKLYEEQQQQRAHIQTYIDRFGVKATKAKQAQSRIKMLERMEKLEPAPIDAFFVFHFLEPISRPNILCTLKSVSFGYQSTEKKILKKINFQITGQQRIGLLGPNGTGKSTFMKLLAGRLQPQEGQYDKHDKLKIGYFTQHALDQLVPQKSPLEHLQLLNSKATELELRKFLGRFRFSGNKVFDPVGSFSGGEKARLAIALIVWQRPNLLLLDEPTNHLDIDMCEALIAALKKFPGALVVISHDRYLLEKVVDEFYLISEGTLKLFSGSMADYEKELLRSRFSKTKSSKKNSEKKGFNEKNPTLKTSKNQIQMIEKELKSLYEKKKNLEQELLQITTSNSKTVGEALKKNRLAFKDLEELIASLESQWMVLNQSQ